LILPGKEVKGSDYIREVGNKFVIKVRKSQEETDAFYRCRVFPVLNSGEFGRIHFDLALSNDHAQEIHFGGVENAFGQFKA
jgi:hypothetical protein